MKTPKWERGKRGSCGKCPPKNGKMLLPDDPAEVGMNVTAKCGGVEIDLNLIEEIGPQVFKAEVIGDYFLGEPEELNYRDEVSISRDFILVICEKE